MHDNPAEKFQFTLRQAGVYVLAGCVSLALSLWLTRHNGRETAVDMVQLGVIVFALSYDRRATWPGVAGGAMLAAGDCLWSVMTMNPPASDSIVHSGTPPPPGLDYHWAASVSFYWATFAGWFGAGASALVRGRRRLGAWLVASAVAWLFLTFFLTLAMSRLE